MQELDLARQLSDIELIAKLTCCVREDREVTARLLVHLGEVDARGLFRDHGFSSMFDYAVQALHMSESEAWLRIRAARLAREFPAAIGMVARGELHMTALKLLAPVLTPDSIGLLDQARFKSKVELQELIAKHFPAPDVQSSMRKLPALRSTCERAQTQIVSGPQQLSAMPEHAECATPVGPAAATPNSSEVATAVIEAIERKSEAVVRDCTPCAHSSRTLAAVSSSRRNAAPSTSSMVPLSEGRYKVQFTASQSVRDMFIEARDLLQEQVPNGDLGAIVERALQLLIAERKKQRFAQTNRLRRQRPSEAERTASEAERTPAHAGRSPAQPDARASKPNTRHIANALRRQIYERDGGRCAFVSADGRRCCARRRLEFHHIKPFARGGEATFDNIALVCRAHNALFADRDYGREFMQQRIAESAAPRPARAQTQNLSIETRERPNKFRARPTESRVSTRTIELGLELWSGQQE